MKKIAVLLTALIVASCGVESDDQFSTLDESERGTEMLATGAKSNSPRLVARFVSGAVLLQWAAGGHKTFVVERDSGSGFRPFRTVTLVWPATVTGAGASVDSSVLPGRSYSYLVYATSGRGSDQSNAVTLTIPGSASTPGKPPVAPSSLRVTTFGSNSVAIAWVDRSTDEQSFQVFRSAAGRSAERVATLAANTQQYSDSGLLPNTQYSYQVIAFNAAGYSPYSNAVQQRTAQQSQPSALRPGPFTINPVPQMFRGTAVAVTWNPSSGATGYEFRLCGDASCQRQVDFQVSSSNATSRVVPANLAAGTYFVVVTAFDGAGNRTASQNALAGQPRYLTVSEPIATLPPFSIENRNRLLKETQVWIYWSRAVGALSYNFVLSSTPDCNTRFIQTSVSENRALITTPRAVGRYYLCVSAYDQLSRIYAATNNAMPIDIVR